MARGWESKAIESQQADRDARRHVVPVRSPEDHARAAKAETVALALAGRHGTARRRLPSDPP